MVGLEVILLFIVAAYIAWGIGANDETMMIVASGSSWSINRLVLIGSITTCLGAILYGQIVEETIGKGILTIPANTQIGLIIVIATATWLTIVSYAGWPVSTSHSTVAAVIGYGLISGSVNWVNCTRIFLSWIVGPFAGLLLSYLLVKPLSKLVKTPQTVNSKGWLYILLCGALVQEFWQGANNVSNATSFLSVTSDFPLLSRTFGGIFLAVGLFTLGRRVLTVAGLRIARLPLTAAFGTQLVIVVLNIIGTIYGLPVSGTHVSVACLIGAGLATKTKIDYRLCRNVILYWLITLPGAAFFTILFTSLPSLVHKLGTIVGYP